MEESITNAYNSVIIKSSSATRLNFYGDYPKVPSFLKQSSELSSINPELCLSRKNILSDDRKAKITKIILKRSPRDISHLLDGPKRVNSIRSLPISLEDMKRCLYENNSRNPTSAKEIDNLQNWLMDMNKMHLPGLETFLQEENAPDSAFVEKIETIYFLAFAEILRQVSVQSKSRAEVLKYVFFILERVWKKYPNHLLYLAGKQKEQQAKVAEDIKQSYKDKIKDFKANIRNLQKKIEAHAQEKEALINEVSNLKHFISKTHWEYEEYFKFKSKQLRMVASECQTDIILEDYNEEKNLHSSSRSEDVSFGSEVLKDDESEYEIRKLSKGSNLGNESKRLEFIEEIKKTLVGIGGSLDLDFDSLAKMINNEAKDFQSWLHGFKMALNFVQIQSEQVLRHSPVSTVIDSKPEISMKPQRVLTINTKFKQPLLRRPTLIKTATEVLQSTPKDSNSASSVISAILSQPFSRLAKLAKTSSKKIVKHINNFIYAAINKKYSKSMNFSEFVYGGILEKYNMKALAERKLQEFITACLMYYNENKKVAMFLSCMNAGSKFNLPDMSNEGAEMFIKIYEFMIQSRVGVIIDISHPLSCKYFPVIRATDCVKLKFDGVLSKLELNQLLEVISKMTVTDPSSINKSGVVDIDEFVYTAASAFEQKIQKVRKGVSTCLKVTTDYNYLTRGEALLILRHLASHKCNSVYKTLQFDEKNELNNNLFLEACINNGILSSDSVDEFFAGSEKNPKVILEYIKEHSERITMMATLMADETMTDEEWQSKFEDLNFKLRGVEPTRYLHLWHLMNKEIEYLKSCL